MFPGMGKTTLGWEPQTQSILTGGRPSYNFPYMPPSCHKLLNTLTNHIMPPTILPTASWTGKALWVLESGLDSSNFNCSLIYVVFKSRVPVLQSLRMLWHICLPRMSTNRNPTGNTLLPALRYILPTINILIFRRLVEYYITSLKILILLQLFLLIHFSSSYKNLLSVMTDLPLSPFKHYHPSIIYWALCYRHVN